MNIDKYLYEKCPDSLFLKFINTYRFLHGEQKIKYKYLSKKNWVIYFRDYILYCPSPRWFYSDINFFSNRFEKYFKIKKGDICVDIGSCIGDTTIPMSIKTGGYGKVYSYEPIPYNYSFLKRNTKEYSNIDVYMEAISNRAGISPMYIHNEITGNSLSSIFNMGLGTININCITLDDLIKKTGFIDFCKIDIQGFETKIFESGKIFLENIGKLIVATHEYGTKNDTKDIVIDILDGCGCFKHIKFGFDGEATFLYAF